MVVSTIALLSALALVPTAWADSMVIDDFSGETSTSWRFFTDQVMGGVSTGRAVIEGGALRLTGDVSTANNGGFIQARIDLPDRLGIDTTGLRIRTKGDGQRYFLHVRTTRTRLPWQYYQVGFETGASWQDVEIALRDFRPSGKAMKASPRADEITSVALVAYGRNHKADVWLDRIEAVSP